MNTGELVENYKNLFLYEYVKEDVQQIRELLFTQEEVEADVVASEQKIERIEFLLEKNEELKKQLGRNSPKVLTPDKEAKFRDQLNGIKKEVEDKKKFKVPENRREIRRILSRRLIELKLAFEDIENELEVVEGMLEDQPEKDLLSVTKGENNEQ